MKIDTGTVDDPNPAIRKVPRGTEVFELPKKLMVLRLRWVVVIVCSYLLLYADPQWLGFSTAHYFTAFYVLSNAVLYLVDERLFESSCFYCPLVLFDTLCVTASIMASSQVGTDFYLVYFLIIILCAVWQDFHGLIAVAVMINLVYGYLLFNQAEINDPSVYLRLPFLFTVSLFYGYFAEIVRGEKALRLQAQVREAIAEHLAEASRLKSDFLTATAMELRSPIAAIAGYGDLLFEGAFGPVTESQRKALGRLMENARGMLGLVEEMAYSLDGKQTLLFMKRQEIAPLIEDLRDELAPLEYSKPYRIRYEIESGISPIVTDWGLLKRILINILTHAVKFTYEGEIALSVKNGTDGEVSFVVFESGHGIPRAKFPLIMETYRELAGSPARDNVGLGLGNAASKNLLDRIGGKLTFESEVGKGSTFTFTIPSLLPGDEVAPRNFTWIGAARKTAVAS